MPVALRSGSIALHRGSIVLHIVNMPGDMSLCRRLSVALLLVPEKPHDCRDTGKGNNTSHHTACDGAGIGPGAGFNGRRGPVARAAIGVAKSG